MSSPFVWFDLEARDAEPVLRFYHDLLGWDVAPDETPGSPYAGWIRDGEQPWAAITHANGDRSGRWIPYVRVEDLDAAAEQAAALGASVVQGRTTGPAGDAVLIADPGGALVALWTPHAATTSS